MTQPKPNGDAAAFAESYQKFIRDAVESAIAPLAEDVEALRKAILHLNDITIKKGLVEIDIANAENIQELFKRVDALEAIVKPPLSQDPPGSTDPE